MNQANNTTYLQLLHPVFTLGRLVLTRLGLVSVEAVESVDEGAGDRPEELREAIEKQEVL